MELNNFDYEKFKKEILGGKASAIAPTQEAIEKEKDKRFQDLCKELWPNIYSKIKEPQVKAVNLNELLEELEKKKMICDNIIKNDLERFKAHNNATFSDFPLKPTETVNIYIDRYGSISQPNSIHMTNSKPYEMTTNIEPTKLNPNNISSYNFPFYASKYSDIQNKSYPYTNLSINEKLGIKTEKPSLSDENEQLLKTIKESQEKLKMNKKIEKTTEIVDELIGQFKQLQDEMKRKSLAIQLKSELDDLKKQRDFNRRYSINHYDDASLVKSNRSRSRERNEYASYRTRSNSPVERSCSKHSRPSILKETVHVPICSHKKYPTVSFQLTKRDKSKSPGRRSCERSSESYGVRDWSYVEPRVKCWNCNCTKDQKVY